MRMTENLAKMLYPTRFAAFVVLTCFVSIQSIAQMVATGATNTQQAVELLMGEGVEAFNIQSTGAANQVGSFTCNNCGIGFPSGMIVATGNVAVANGPNNTGAGTLGGGNFGVSDPDLAMLVNSSLHDAATVTFQFVAQSDSVSFNYVFASEEYPTFVNSTFNDVFGFFLSGPGINGPFSNNAINIALIPGTTLPVSINNVNAGTNDMGCNNCQYYVVNTGNPDPFTTQFDGFTVPLEASYDQLICGETYTIKIAIADAGDTSYDSAVFFEANSFTLPTIDVTLEMPDIGFDENTLYEGCGLANIVFTRTTGLQNEEEIVLNISGTATNGVDYTFIPDTIFFEPGQAEYVIPLQAFIDDEEEGLESIIIEYTALGLCTTSTTQTLEIFIIDVAPLEIEIEDQFINCLESATLVPTITGGYGVYEVTWENLGVADSIEVSPSVTTEYPFVVSDTCGLAPANATVTVHVPVLDPVQPIVGDPIGIDCLTELSTTGDAEGGNGEYSFEWFDPFGTSISTEAFVEYTPELPGSLLLQVTDGCGSIGEAELEFFFNEVPIELALPDNVSALCLDEVTVSTSVLEGGIGNITLQWTVDGADAGSGVSASFMLSSETTVQVVATDECGNSAEANTVVTVDPSPVTVTLPQNPIAQCIEDFELTTTSIDGGVGVITYDWQVNGDDAGSESSVVINISDPATVSVTVTDGCGNSGNASTLVNIAPLPISVDLGDDFIVPCLDQALVVADVDGGAGEMAYSWILNELPQQVTSDQIEFVAMGSMGVQVTVVDVCGNTASDQLTVFVPDNPPNVVTSADTIICKGQSVKLWAEVIDPIGSINYAWLPTGHSSSEINVSPQQTTTYTVAATDICNQTTIKTIQVVVDQVRANFDFSYIGSWSIQTFNTSAPANASFVWDFGDGTTSEEFEPTHNFIDNNRQTVTLYAESELGCRDSITGVFEPIMDIYVPTAFTPNGDGINDVFMAKGNSIREFQMWIYNRWGELIFYSEDINEPWLGEVKGGEHFAQDEVYTWVIKAVGVRNNSFERSGTVILLR